MGGWDWLTGSGDKLNQVSTLNKGQQGLQNQMLGAMNRRGAGGGFGQAADYYRDLLDPGGQAAQQFEAPMMRQFQEEIVPGLSEQFAGMGAGNLSSSSFRNAQVGAGKDLSERLAAMRAGLRQQGAQGMMGLGGMAMQPTQQNVVTGGQTGLLPAAGAGFAGAFGKSMGMGLF